MKYVGAAEFKAKCLQLMDEVQAGGEPITVTKRGKPVATLSAVEAEAGRPDGRGLIGCLASPEYRFDDPFTPVADMEQWDANNPAELYGRP
jgi:prevent-host-death family protein